MALRNIRVNDEPCLYKRCRPVDRFDGKLSELIDDMFETMYEHDGVGLAGPQVGILRRVAVVDANDRKMELVNPEIIVKDGVQGAYEGCLSFPGQSGYVERAEHVTVRGLDRHGNMQEFDAHGLEARAVQHELDHLDGIVYLTRKTEPPEGFEEAFDEEEDQPE